MTGRVGEIEAGEIIARIKRERDPDAGEQHKANGGTKRPVQWIDMSDWDSVPVPKRGWLVLDRIPLRQPTLLSGEGAVGKSILVLHLLASTALGRDWLRFMPEPGPAWYVGAEDDADELHIRLTAIQQHFGVSFADLVNAGFRMKSLYGEDAVLGAVNRHGLVEPTELYSRLYEEAGDVKPKCISLDASADMFAGDEINRVQVRQFVGLLRRLAGVCNGAVILLSHPSLTGINTGTGLSGTTGWHNSVRARAYFTSLKPEKDEQGNSDLRELSFKKNNYGPVGETIALRYQHGLFLPEGGISSLDKLGREQKADEIFLDLLARFEREGRNVSATQTAPTYAPASFCKEQEARGIRKDDLADAMRRLFAAKKIHIENYGRPSRPASRLIVGAKGD